MTTPEHPYSPSLFDADYYGNRARGGFGPEIKWDNPDQQNQLAIKFAVCAAGGPYDSILFVGCALGAEPLYFSQRGKQAQGIDVSTWAIENALPEAKSLVRLFDGETMPFFEDKQFDVVAAFDVLTLVPAPMADKLSKEMQRVSRNRIVVRGIARETGKEWDGNDGVSFKYKSLKQWKTMFADQFNLDLDEHNDQQEHTFTFVRKS
jgi:2-polyprenyl-3-methyl-5-hydroxy-6-metoxy-1,4-benzoquinol methylase